jgi:hypothetical protein
MTVMDNNFLCTDDMLWDYADGLLGPAEAQRLEAYLRQHPEQRERLEAIRAEKRQWAALPIEQPDPGFADRVMAALAAQQRQAAPAAAPRHTDWVVRAIAAAIGVFMLLPLGALLFSGQKVAPEPLPEQYLPKLPQIPLGDWLGSPLLRYGLLLLAIVLALQVIDRYLQQKKLLDRLHAA